MCPLFQKIKIVPLSFKNSPPLLLPSPYPGYDPEFFTTKIFNYIKLMILSCSLLQKMLVHRSQPADSLFWQCSHLRLCLRSFSWLYTKEILFIIFICNDVEMRYVKKKGMRIFHDNSKNKKKKAITKNSQIMYQDQFVTVNL